MIPQELEQRVLRVGDLVKTSRGQVKIEKVHMDGTYTVILDRVIVMGVLTNTFRAKRTVTLQITGPERYDD